MEAKTKRDGQEGSRRESSQSEHISIIDSIQFLAARNARADLSDENQLLLFLQSWWSRTYNRPLKDPLLLSYSIEDLLYEFYDRIERQKAEEERALKEENDKEEAKEKEGVDWAEQEERKELAMLKARAAQQENKAKDQDPTKDPGNIAWMEEQLKKGKILHGESYGEDIEESFDEF